MNEQPMTSVQGLSQLLRAVAGRMQGDVDGLNKELLLQSAEQLDKLEMVANMAECIINAVPHAKRGRDRKSVLVAYRELVELATALQDAGKEVSRVNV